MSSSINMLVITSTPDVVRCNAYETDKNVRQKHRNCLDATASLPAFPAIQADDLTILAQHEDAKLPLLPGKVYDVLDFCYHRAPVWYRAEVDRISHLSKAKNKAESPCSPSHASSLMHAWESSYAMYLEQQATLKGIRTLTTSSATAKIKLAPPPRKPPTRVQPDRPGKRKAPAAGVEVPRAVKRRKTTPKAAANRVSSSYHIPKSTFSKAIHASLTTASDLHGRLCQHGYRSFRNGLIDRVAGTMVSIYQPRTAEGKSKPRRCALEGYETASPWCKAGGHQVPGHGDRWKGDTTAMRCQTAATPAADMLHSPTCANWPPPPKVRLRMAREDIEDNVVEFEGLRFLVDVCGGELPVPRILML